MISYLGFAAFILLWIGQMIYTIGKQNRFNDDIRKDIDSIETQVDNLRTWGENQIAERTKYAQTHYITVEMCGVQHRELIRRMEIIEGYNINVELATIKTQLTQVLAALEELKKRG